MSHLTLVFDLDGTLVDTAPDLAAATNHVMASLELPAVDPETLRRYVGHGALRMIEAALGDKRAAAMPEEELYAHFNRFLAYYEDNIAVFSRPFDGVIDAIKRFKANGARCAVCTNKSERLARRLLQELEIDGLFAAIAGRDTFPVYKPDPGHLLRTVAAAGGDASRAVMIGDSPVDFETARNAGVPVVLVSFGYTDTPAASLEPDALIDHYRELDAAISKLNFAATAPAPVSPSH